MENTEAIWQQRLAKRREGTPWKAIIEAEGFKYGGTFTGHLKIARARGWIPPEATLPPAIRSDGKRVGLSVPKQEAPTPEDVVEVLPGQLDLDADTGAAAPVSTIVDVVAVSEASEPLSLREVQTLEHYEQIIAQGMQTFVEVGHALLAIREQRLYRQAYQTFEDYLRQRWDLSRPRAYQLIDAAQVVDTVSTSVDIVPMNEAQARPLASLSPEQQREVWQEAVKTAPPSGITAKHVQAIVKRAKVIPAATKPPGPKKSAPTTIEGLALQWHRRLTESFDQLDTLLLEFKNVGGVTLSVPAMGRQQQETLLSQVASLADIRLPGFVSHLRNIVGRG
jgi:hypothetical protein